MTTDNDPTKGNSNENPFPLPPQKKDAQEKESRNKLVDRIDKLQEDIGEADRKIESLKRETKQQLENMVKDIDNRWWLKPETAAGLAISALAVTLGTFYHLTLRADSVHSRIDSVDTRMERVCEAMRVLALSANVHQPSPDCLP